MSLLDYKSFLNEGFIFEGKKVTAKQEPFFAAYAKLFPSEPAPKNTKTEEIIRARFGADGPIAEDNIRKLFTEVFANKQDFKIDFITMHPKGEIRKGDALGSASYATYEVKVGTDTYWVTNAAKAAKDGTGTVEVGKKLLTPSELGLNGEYKTAAELAAVAESAIKGVSWLSNKTKSFLIDCINSTATKTRAEFGSMGEFFAKKEHSSTISLSKNYDEPATDATSLQNIINDFGEVLDGIFVLASIGGASNFLNFPAESNKPLLDIECDGYDISSKDIRGGGSPSAAPIFLALRDEKTRKQLALTDEENSLADILAGVATMDAYDQFMTIASMLIQRGDLSSDCAFNHISQTFKDKKISFHGNYPTKAEVTKFLDSLPEDEYVQFIDDLNAKSGYKPNIAALNASKRIGAMFANIAKEVGSALTNNYEKAFSSITNKVLSMKQIYMTITFKGGNTIKYLAKSTTSMDAKFDTSKNAVNTPFNGRLSFTFKMK